MFLLSYAFIIVGIQAEEEKIWFVWMVTYILISDGLIVVFMLLHLSISISVSAPPRTLPLSYRVSFLVKAQLFAICLSHPFAGTLSMKTRQFGVKWMRAGIGACVWMCVCVAESGEGPGTGGGEGGDTQGPSCKK